LSARGIGFCLFLPFWYLKLFHQSGIFSFFILFH